MSTTWRFNIPALLQLVIVAEALGLMTRSPSSSPPGRDELHVTSVPPDCLSLIYLNRVCFAAQMSVIRAGCGSCSLHHCVCIQTSSERVLVTDCRLLSENASFGLEEQFQMDISVKI